MSAAGHIRQRGNAWEIRFSLPPGADGKRRVETRTVRGSKRDAQRALRAAQTAVDRHEHVDQNRRTVGAYIRDRIEQWQASGRFGERTAEQYRVLAKTVAAHLGDVPLQKLSTIDVERMHSALRAKGLTRTTTEAHALLARALADAVKHKLVVRNVAREQGRPPIRRGARPAAAFTADDARTLLTKLAGDPWRIPVVVALHTGLRRGEQLALRWHHVDLDVKVLRVREALDETKAAGVTVKLPKSAAGLRSISLSADVIDALHEQRRQQLERCLLLGRGRPSGDALVFPDDDGGYMAPRAFSHRWGRRAANLGMPDLTWHSLRHAHASMLIALGRPITEVAARLGHADPAITLRVYAHLFTKDDAAAAAAIDRAFR